MNRETDLIRFLVDFYAIQQKAQNILVVCLPFPLVYGCQSKNMFTLY
jgi:hypothetical protein